MGICLLIVTSTAVLTLVGMSRGMAQIEEEYEERAEIGLVRERVSTARALLEATPPARSTADDALSSADTLLSHFVAGQEDQEAGGDEHQASESAAAAEIRLSIQHVRAMLTHQNPSEQPAREATADEFESIDFELRQLLGETDDQVSQAGDLAQKELTLGLIFFGSVTLVSLLVGVLGAVFTYRSIMGPIRGLRDQIHQASQSVKGSSSAPTSGDDLSAIRTDFVDVVSELDDLYHTLEDRINRKSQELVRAERLASVGYLAAGIAHEINNPLNAISGYSELISRQLSGADEERFEEAIEALGIVQREAMRCKGITDRLLSLSRKSPDAIERVNLAKVVSQTVALIDGLPHLAGRSIHNHLTAEAGLDVHGVHSELTQVFLNLIVNAAEACELGTGVIEINGRVTGGRVEITVSDNGEGMTKEVQEHLFEPFFTQKRGQQGLGTGLGLSIVHAIALDYGGKVHADSDGPGKGSRIIVTLPAYEQVQP